MVAFIHQTWNEMAESLHCILGQSTLLSQCLSLPKNLKGYLILKKKKRTGKNLFEHMKLMSQLKAHKNIHADGQGSQMKCCGGGRGGENHAMDWYPIQGGREVIILVTSCYGKRSLQCRHLIRAS